MEMHGCDVESRYVKQTCPERYTYRSSVKRQRFAFAPDRYQVWQNNECFGQVCAKTRLNNNGNNFRSGHSAIGVLLI